MVQCLRRPGGIERAAPFSPTLWLLQSAIAAAYLNTAAEDTRNGKKRAYLNRTAATTRPTPGTRYTR
jgi:hypothetical protein